MNYSHVLKYDSKRRFASYWHQIAEVLALEPDRVLEIGIGTQFVSKYLAALDILVITVDINASSNPDHVMSVTHLTLPENSFPVVLACEILEHISYDDFVKALQQLHRVSSGYVVTSLPDATHASPIQFSIPGIGKYKWMITLPYMFPKTHTITKDGHQWEIGKKGYPLSRICSDITSAHFQIEKTYRVFENPYHRFFILKKM